MGHVVKVKKHLLLEQNKKTINDDISVVKQPDISNLLKAVIPRKNLRKHTKFTHYTTMTDKTLLCITRLMSK